MPKKALIAGALGVVGRAALRELELATDWELVGLSRREPDFKTRADFRAVDLRDRSRCARALEDVRGVTHLVYAALHEKPQLVSGWTETDHGEINLAMLENLLDAIESPALEHITLLQGTKAYGAHTGRPSPLPAREREPRFDHQNFYFLQQDRLVERQAGRDWAWTILRPQVVLGVAVGSAMNVVGSIGAYAALCRELDRPFSHPGHANAVAECVDARLLARAIEWAATTPACANEVFNIANGDVIAWRDLWPEIAAFHGLPLGAPELCRMSEEMPKHAETWRKLADREGLRVNDLDALIGLSWQYADLLWGAARVPERPPLISTIKAREFGFQDCIDTGDAILQLLGEMQRERYLP